MIKLFGLIIFLSRRLYIKSTRLSHKYKWRRKIRRLIRSRNIQPISSGQIKEIKKFYASHGLNTTNTSWHRFYSESNGRFDVGYLPEDLFYTQLEPKLNRDGFSNILSDKNLLDRLFSGVKQPNTILKNINGFFLIDNQVVTQEDALNACNALDSVVIKPSIDSGGGKNVEIYQQSEEDNLRRLRNLFDRYAKDFIVQEKVEQNRAMEQLNETSLNTFRVMTFLKGDKVFILSTIVRMGQKGSKTDNSTSGGISCGVKENGRLNDVGFKLNGERFYRSSMEHKFSDIEFPFIFQIHESAKKLHLKIPYFRIISWDLTYDKHDEVVLIEYNIKGQDINFHQLNNGPVLRVLLNEL